MFPRQTNSTEIFDVESAMIIIRATQLTRQDFLSDSLLSPPKIPGQCIYRRHDPVVLLDKV